MSYVWEYISEEDKRRIGFDELTRLCWKNKPSSWAIERETGNFVLNVTQREEDTRGRQDYVFGWNGLVVPIESIYEEVKHGDRDLTFHLVPLRTPPLPPDREADRRAMLAEFVKAAACHISLGGRAFKANVTIDSKTGETE